MLCVCVCNTSLHMGVGTMKSPLWLWYDFPQLGME